MRTGAAGRRGGRILLVLALVLSLSPAAAARQHARPNPAGGEPPALAAALQKLGMFPFGRVEAPDFALEDLSGAKVKLSDFRGKVVLMNFWTTW